MRTLDLISLSKLLVCLTLFNGCLLFSNEDLIEQPSSIGEQEGSYAQSASPLPEVHGSEAVVSSKPEVSSVSEAGGLLTLSSSALDKAFQPVESQKTSPVGLELATDLSGQRSDVGQQLADAATNTAPVAPPSELSASATSPQAPENSVLSVATENPVVDQLSVATPQTENKPEQANLMGLTGIAGAVVPAFIGIWAAKRSSSMPAQIIVPEKDPGAQIIHRPSTSGGSGNYRPMARNIETEEVVGGPIYKQTRPASSRNTRKPAQQPTDFQRSQSFRRSSSVRSLR